MATGLDRTQPVSPVTVLIADDERTVRGALASFLDSEDGVRLVGAAADAEEAIALAERLHPDIALVDVKMPKGGGAAAARGIRSASPDTRVVALSAHDDRSSVLEMVRAGAIGYLVKGTPGSGIVDAIFNTARGHGALSVEVTGDVIRELARQLDVPDVAGASARIARVERLLSGSALEIVFQPIVELRTLRTIGVEALARFDVGEVRSPEVWFREAQELGLRHELELAAIDAALAHLGGLPRDVLLSVNVSPAVLASTRFLDAIEGVDGTRLVVEVTEHARVDDYGVLHVARAALRANGVRLAIDDAGAGFASMQHVVELDPEFIKLDIELTRGIDADASRRALARSLIAFASEISATIVAEGVETAAEFETLRSLGVALGQGFYLGLPTRLPGLALPPRES